MTLVQKCKIMDAGEMSRTLHRISTEIMERIPDHKNLVLVGIQTRGVPLARRIHQEIPDADIGILDITFYRDDLTIIGPSPVVHKTEIQTSLDGKRVVLIDDVLFTGRTIRAAIDCILDYGRPASILLAVLVDRGHRELPIQADFVGRNIPTAFEEIVDVRVTEVDGEDGVVILEKEGVAHES